MTLNEVHALSRAPGIDGQDVLETLFQWRRERHLVVVRGSLAFAASLIVALGLALLKGEVKMSPWVGLAVLAGIVSVAGYGLLVLVWTLPSLNREYLFAVRLYEAFKS